MIIAEGGPNIAGHPCCSNRLLKDRCGDFASGQGARGFFRSWGLLSCCASGRGLSLPRTSSGVA